MKNLTTCLWFDGNAEAAVNFYLSVFKDSKRGQTARYRNNPHGEEGSVLTIIFQINGQDFLALNGGPMYKLTPAISFIVNCDTQDEIDYYWNKLTEGGGTPVQCGWLTDKFGVSWQIVPTKLGEWISGDAAKAGRVMAALLEMIKLDIAELQKAAEEN